MFAIIFLLAAFLALGLIYVIYVFGGILIGSLCTAFGQAPKVRDGAADASQLSEGAAPFIPGFRKAHWIILAVFNALFSCWTFLSISPGDWRGWDSHPYRAIFLTISGPFTAALLQPTSEHWKAAWGIFPFCAAFLLLGILCQLKRLPRQRDPQSVSLLIWLIGLLGWFNGAVLSLLLAW